MPVPVLAPAAPAAVYASGTAEFWFKRNVKITVELAGCLGEQLVRCIRSCWGNRVVSRRAYLRFNYVPRRQFEALFVAPRAGPVTEEGRFLKGEMPPTNPAFVGLLGKKATCMRRVATHVFSGLPKKEHWYERHVSRFEKRMVCLDKPWQFSYNKNTKTLLVVVHWKKFNPAAVVEE